MMTPIAKLNFGDLTDTIPAFCVIVMMCFAYNLGVGITAGFLVYPLIKLFSGRGREVSPGMWILGVMSALFFVFYPY
jgi:AGZA family xanthine/uracil permease-like MFS transporter